MNAPVTVPVVAAAEVGDLAQARARIAELEALLRAREREATLNEEQMGAVYAYLLGLYEVVPGALVTISPRGQISRTNRGFHSLLGVPDGQIPRDALGRIWPEAPSFIERCCAPGTSLLRDEVAWVNAEGEHLPILVSAACQRAEDGEVLSILCVGLDLREQRKLEMELRHAQKLESLGQLAAGIAHEINTPLQFVGDNLHFLHDTLPELFAVVDAACQPPLSEALQAALATADLDYLRERLPRAARRSIEGVSRVAAIVDAMKRFSHLKAELAPMDVNHALADALTVSHNAYKYVADVITHYGELPLVTANAGDLNQVFLNLLVNAAHAIEARGSSERGTITVSTRQDGEWVRIEIADTGTGIAPDIRHRVFDPFFTTKEVGKGTGQGLSLARSIVVDRHHGRIEFESEPGVGTSFIVHLPLGAAAGSPA